MNTPMQEMLEWVRVTLPMDLDTSRLIEEKVISMLEKEKEVMCEFALKYDLELGDVVIRPIEDCFDETFNTKEK